MRLRLLVPRGGRGRSLGGLAAVAAALALAAVLAPDADDERPRPPAATPTPTPHPLDVPSDGPSLAVGITEPNPSLVAPAGARSVPPEWTRWRDELARIEPDLYRLVVVWSAVQPRPDAPPDLAAPASGCMRDKSPCAPYAGVRDQLRALAARQREAGSGDDLRAGVPQVGGGGDDARTQGGGGWQALVVFTGTPDWAAAAPSGCREEAGSGAPRADALPAYRRLVREVLTAAAAEGAELRYLSPWNEPNHPYFLAPQRESCDRAAPSRAVAPYAALADAMRQELGAEQPLVLGETAGVLERRSRSTTVGEMVRGLPRELVCAAPVWSQHAYIGGTDPVATVTSALAKHRCPHRHAIWITETGVGPAPGGFSLARGITSERQGCRLLHERLRAWHDDPRVTLAVQYTMREDDLFPTGLVTTDLARARPALREWQAWGARDTPADPPPASACESLR